MNNVRHVLTSLSTASLMLLMLTLQSGVRADDIDIYISPDVTPAEAPMVMFSIDYSSQMAAVVCVAGNCPAPIVALYTDGYMLENPATKTIQYFQLLRGVMAKFIYTLKGVKIGIMLSHGSNPCPGNVKTGPNAKQCSNGGYMLHGFKLMTEPDNGNKAAIINTLRAMPQPQGALSHSYQGKELFFEFYRYLSGGGLYNSRNGWTDYGTTNAKNIDDGGDLPGVAPKLMWDGDIDDGQIYKTPIKDENKCAKIYTVNLVWDATPAGPDDQSDDAIKATITNGGIPGVAQSRNLSFNQVLSALYTHDVSSKVDGSQTVTSYFIMRPSPVTGKFTNTQKSYAGGGIGKLSAEPYALSDDPEDLMNTLQAIFRNILSISTTFVAPTVAVNVFNRAQVLDDVYIAMFQAKAKPFWPGNIKKYKLGVNAAGEREIQDAKGNFAVDPVKGRIKPDALSYWTYPNDLPYPPTGEDEFTFKKDGRGVARGAAGSKIPGYKLRCASDTDTKCYPGDYSPGLANPSTDTTNVTTRKVFYDLTVGPVTTLAPLNADIATAALLHTDDFGGTVAGDCTAADAVANPGSSCNLIIYARGAAYIDHDNDEGKPLPTPRILRGRDNGDWALGDFLHSRPVAINYGLRSSDYNDKKFPDVRIVAGSNDGLMHMFRDRKNSSAPENVPNDQDGVETWAFMPRAVMHAVKTLHKDQPVTPPHPYTVDGSPAVYVLDRDRDGTIKKLSDPDKTDKVWLFFGLRRGGKSIYALDVTDPDNPSLMWTITGGVAGTDFEQLNQTWSTPTIGYMLFDGSQTPRPVLLFGGGYDPNKDKHPGHTDAASGIPYTELKIGTNDSKGAAFFIVNAETGELVWKAITGDDIGAASYAVFKHKGLTDSIPSEVTAVDTNGNGLIDRAYFGDTGGKLWRADLFCHHQSGNECESFCKNSSGSPCTKGWKLTPVLSAGRHYKNELADDRRFFYAPDFAKSSDGLGRFDAVVIGTGDREAPKYKSVKNWFYMYKDRFTLTGSIPDDFVTVEHGDLELGEVTSDCLQTGGCGTPPNLTKGWKMRLHCQLSDLTNSCGEKNLAPALTIGGNIYFTTYIPPGAGGVACTLPEGSGLFYAVELQRGFAVEDFFADDSETLTRLDRATALASGGIPAEAVSLGPRLLAPDLTVKDINAKTGFRTFWYEPYLK